MTLISLGKLEVEVRAREDWSSALMQRNSIKTWSRVHSKGANSGEAETAGVKWRVTASIQDQIEIRAGNETEASSAIDLWSWVHFEGTQERYYILTEDIVHLHELIGDQRCEEEITNDIYSCNIEKKGKRDQISLIRLYLTLIGWLTQTGEEQRRR